MRCVGGRQLGGAAVSLSLVKLCGSARRAAEQRCAHRAARFLAEARRSGEVEDVVGALAAAGAESDREPLRAALKQVDHRMLAGDLGAAGLAYGELLAIAHPESRLAWGKLLRWVVYSSIPAARGMVFPMRVLFVIPGEVQGSSMIFARRQAESLAREGVGVEVFHLRSRTSLWALAREGVRFRRRVRSFDPQLIHAHFGTATALFAAWAAPLRPLVITFRGSDLNVSRSLRSIGGACVVANRMLMRARRIVCVSRQLQNGGGGEGVVAILPRIRWILKCFCPEPRCAARQRLGWG